MKHNLCYKHAYHKKNKTRPIQLTDEAECSICRWDKRPDTKKDIARKLEDTAYSMRHAFDNPNYDPFGFSYAPDMENIILGWIKAINEPYKKQLVDKINQEYENSGKEAK